MSLFKDITGRLKRWVFGNKPKEYNRSCPTCGPIVVNHGCGDEVNCEEMAAGVNALIDRFDYIYTKNKYKTLKRKKPEACDPPDTVATLTNTGNRCNKIGEVHRFSSGAMICLECADCGDAITPRAEDQPTTPKGPTASGSKATVDLTTLPNGDCMVDNSCPDTSCGYWYHTNFVRVFTPPGNMTIEGREKRNRPAPEDSLTPRSGCSGNSCSAQDPCQSPCNCEYTGTDEQGQLIGVCTDGGVIDPGDGDGDGDGGDKECACCHECDGGAPVWPFTCDCCSKCDETTTGTGPDAGNGQSECTGTPIYDETGCRIIGYKPAIVARGLLGYWESESDVYPFTKLCDGSYMYGKDAGKPVRRHKMPDRALESHFVSFGTGVRSHLDPGNKESNNSFVRIIRLEIRNLKRRVNTFKPLNEANPYSIMYVKRDESNKSVGGSGLAINTHMMYVNKEKFATGKLAVNSFEYFNKYNYYGGEDSHRGGENMDKAAMVFYSPDLLYNRPGLDFETMKFERPIFGKGMRHYMYSQGENPDNRNVGRENQKGTGQSINLNHQKKPVGNNGKSINKCVQAIAYADADSIIDKGEKFSYPLFNLYKERSVYVELKGDPVKLQGTRNTATPNNGHLGVATPWDGTSDFSFLGDMLYHMCPIHDAAAWYCTLKRALPNQYGGVVNQVYAVLYHVTAADMDMGSFIAHGGDSYVNQHTLVRKAYVSDKIMEEISPLLVGGGLPASDSGFIGGLLRTMFEAVGLEECATVPDSGDPGDPRNGWVSIAGEKNNEIRTSNAARCWNGVEGAMPLPTGKDIYYPNVLNTLIYYYVESDVNLHFRQTGDIDAGEIHATKLKGQNLHSELPMNSDWKKGFLNRFHVLSKENPKQRMVMRVIYNLLFTYGVGIYFIIDGVAMAMNTLAQMNIGWTEFNLGGIIGSLIEIGVAVVGFLWIKFWANHDLDNRFWDNVLGIDGCWPDITEFEFAGAGRKPKAWRIKDGRIRGFEDNYFRYNYDHSRVNDIGIYLGIPDPYPTCVCPTETSYDIMYSNKQNPASPTDAYRNFKANNFREVPSHSGKLKEIFLLGDRMFLKTTDGMFGLNIGRRTVQLGDGLNAYQGDGSVLSLPTEMFGGLKEGKGGTTDPNASETSQWGRISIDVEARSITLFDGNNYYELGDFGMSKFLDRMIPYEATKYSDQVIVDEKTPDGVGFSIGIDNELKLIHITKIDKRGSGESSQDRSWTLTFDPVNMAWVGFEWFTPLLYVWNRFKIYSFKDNEMWSHNKIGEFQTVYGEYHPTIIDFVIRDPENDGAFTFNSSSYNVEFDEYDGAGFISRMKAFFTSIGMHNSWQSMGMLPFEYAKDLTTTQKATDNFTRVLYTNINRFRRFNQLFDKVKSGAEETRFMTVPEEDIYIDFIEVDGDDKKPKQSKVITDNFMLQRVVNDNPENNKLKILLKSVKTEVETKDI